MEKEFVKGSIVKVKK